MDPIRTLHPLSRAWLLDGPLSADLDAYLTLLERGRYAEGSIEKHLCALAHFSQWMTRCRLAAEQLDEDFVDQFLNHHLPRFDWRAGTLTLKRHASLPGKTCCRCRRPPAKQWSGTCAASVQPPPSRRCSCAGIPRGRSHSLRHTLACRPVNSGGSLKAAANVLRHWSLNTSPCTTDFAGNGSTASAARPSLRLRSSVRGARAAWLKAVTAASAQERRSLSSG